MTKKGSVLKKFQIVAQAPSADRRGVVSQAHRELIVLQASV